MECTALFLLYVITRPFCIIRQIWEDYQRGRNMRKRIAQERGPGKEDCRLEEAEDETEKLRDRRDIPVLTTERSSPSKDSHEDQEARSGQRCPVNEHWVHQGGEWPRRIERVDHRHLPGNAHGIWGLEEKDVFETYRETQNRPHPPIRVTVPQARWTFPRHEEREDDIDIISEEECDELVEWTWL
ncbi:hypothetical protein SAMD00023353_1400800 [Rosellinia necatrix]|uniref:Uncharacterized protein n=1 Tax=Rosellinia necatrix TaxID=77044 RepID=A0A1S8A718_ROSNE|nr:hypothetical protein SAMD00023353_1400800 [Rosellinia necatrix]